MLPLDRDWYRNVWTLDIQNQSWTEDAARQVDFIIQTLHLSGKERILDLACGFGRHALEFARRGYPVVGIDLTQAYVEYAKNSAKAANLPAQFYCMDLREVAFKNEFDVVLNLADGAIGYLENESENNKIFAVIARALKPGGQHLMDLMNGEYADTHFPCQLWDAGAKGLTLSKFEWDAQTRILLYGQQDFRYGDTLPRPVFDKGCPQRIYTGKELRDILASHGMTLTAAYANFSSRPANVNELQMEICSRKN
ncbi:MAG: class I SAM-dependent methyltransferase [Victivallaceae bacterium]|nr:class I SAM-dependent methyltransferase [Victivallaceae bacterium]